MGVFGHLRESKRLPVVLRAMKRAWDRGADARLLIAGRVRVPRSGARARAVSERPRILRTGHLPEPDFWRFASATDVCVNLRYPAAGESSGIAVRMMGIGKPVVFTAGEEIARIPENACLRVDPGAAEEEMLAETIALAGRATRKRRPRSANEPRSTSRKSTALEKIAARYWEILLGVMD